MATKETAILGCESVCLVLRVCRDVEIRYEVSSPVHPRGDTLGRDYEPAYGARLD